MYPDVRMTRQTDDAIDSDKNGVVKTAPVVILPGGSGTLRKGTPWRRRRQGGSAPANACQPWMPFRRIPMRRHQMVTLCFCFLLFRQANSRIWGLAKPRIANISIFIASGKSKTIDEIIFYFFLRLLRDFSTKWFQNNIEPLTSFDNNEILIDFSTIQKRKMPGTMKSNMNF